jgi:2-keto-4-pentenoate hydratase/2-oxohepta-3-ene-1,7-dioic acid hydratase in catechol pathway
MPAAEELFQPGDLLALLGADATARLRLADGAARARAVDPESVRLLPPIANPSKIICCWVNYREEGAAPPSKTPIFFGKFNNTLIGCHEPICLPRIASKVVVEAELAVIIGVGGHRIPAPEALSHVGGYTIANDVTAFSHRLIDLLGSRGPNMMAKTFDTFAPMGPCLVTSDEIGDPHALRIRQWLNDSLEVDSSTAHMLTDIPQFISYLSEFITLEPGDIILTGSPRPLGALKYLSAGDRVRIEIESLGVLANPVVADPQ